MLTWDPKDPNEVLDYDLDWSARLGQDVINTSAWSVTEGTVVIGATQNTTQVTKVWLSGGTEDDVCGILNRIVTTGGRTMDQTVRLKIKSK